MATDLRTSPDPQITNPVSPACRFDIDEMLDALSDGAEYSPGCTDDEACECEICRRVRAAEKAGSRGAA